MGIMANKPAVKRQWTNGQGRRVPNGKGEI